jgi:hypothetical protein
MTTRNGTMPTLSPSASGCTWTTVSFWPPAAATFVKAVVRAIAAPFDAAGATTRLVPEESVISAP